MNNTYTYLVLFYVLSCAVAFISKIGRVFPAAIIQYSIFSVWIGIAILKLIKYKFKLNQSEVSIKHFFLLFLIPKLTIHIYSIGIYIVGKTNYITTNLKSYLIILSVFSVIYIFKEKVLNYTIVGAILSYSIVIIYDILTYGIKTIPDTIGYIISGNKLYDSSARLYEVHDYTFAIGYILLYYIIIKRRFTKKEVFFLYLVTVFLFMGFKRIQILAIVLIICYAFFSRISKNTYNLFIFTSWSFIIVSYIFIFMLNNNKFFELLNILNINTMGRNYYYKAIIDLCDFTPSFLGLGRNSVSLILGGEYAYLNVLGVHSDILKYFAECGFILFGLWMWYFLIKIVKWIKGNYSFKVLSTYYILSLYTFVIYYTDNIDTYFISQFIYIMVISVIALKEKTNEFIDYK